MDRSFMRCQITSVGGLIVALITGVLVILPNTNRDVRPEGINPQLAGVDTLHVLQLILAGQIVLVIIARGLALILLSRAGDEQLLLLLVAVILYLTKTWHLLTRLA